MTLARRAGPPKKAPQHDAKVAVRLQNARREAMLRPRGATKPTKAATSLDALVARTAEVYANALTDQTRLSYASRWRQFERWTSAHNLTALPATAETVMLFLADAVDSDPPASLSTLRGRLAAINRVHVESGHAAPGDDPAMSMLMRGLGKVVERSKRVEPMSALRIAELRDVVRAMQDEDPRRTRDRALIALNAAGVEPEHLSRMRWTDVQMQPRGVRLALRLGLRDRPGVAPSNHVRIASRPDDPGCPVQALAAWRAVADDTPAQVFTLVDGHGRRDARKIHPYNVRRIIDTRLDSLGADGRAATVAEAMLLLTGAPSAVLRDRALLLVGFAGAFRRNELCLLRWSDITEDPDGLVLRLRRSKTDPAGHGRNVGIPRGRSELTCPVRALAAWEKRVREQLGNAWHDDLRVLSRVGQAGRIGTEGIDPAALTRIVVKRAEAARVAGHWGGRSLRAGFISTAADLDIPLEQIAQQSRHASLDNLIRYIRSDDPFRRNAADWVGL